MTLCAPRLMLPLLLSVFACPLSGCIADGSDEPITVQTTSSSSATTGEEPAPTGGFEPVGTSTDEPPSTSTGAMEDSTGGSSTSGSSASICGDGVVADDEECDEGFADNTPDGACLPTCVRARCGDGLVQAGIEECDHGDSNALVYGGCVPITCKWGPRCGDGEVDRPDEICDPGDPNSQGDDVIGCDAACRLKGKVVFLSSVGYTGKLGGLEGADSLCRGLASTFDSSRADRYIAWLSDATRSPLQRIMEAATFDAEAPYVMRNGIAVADSLADLLAHGPAPGIDITDTYESVMLADVWTNTRIDGLALSSQHHCASWQSESGDDSASIGRNKLPPDSPALLMWQEQGYWTNWKALTCEIKRHLYCFET